MGFNMKYKVFWWYSTNGNGMTLEENINNYCLNNLYKLLSCSFMYFDEYEWENKYMVIFEKII